MKALFLPTHRGALRIWAQPEKARDYVVGIDSASGVRGGDWSVAEVLDVETCDQAAEFRCLKDPNDWGTCCAALGWYYNEALLGFEAEPTSHGLTAVNQAISVGYTNIYRRRHFDQIQKTMTRKLGFRTDQATKPLLIDRIRLALAEGARVYSETLLRELLSMKEVLKVVRRVIESEEHDDCFIAYGIGLLIRDEMLSLGYVRPTRKKTMGWEARHWEEWEAKILALKSSHESRPNFYENLDDGV